MLSSADLSLQQAPPISVPFRFFLTAPLFGLAASLLALAQGSDLMLSRWLPGALAFTHLITLGFLLMVMCGALLQLLPVLATSPVPAVVLVGNVTHLLLTLGTVSLAIGFLFGDPIWMRTALALLALGLLLFMSAVAIALWRIRQQSATTTAIRLALLSLALTIVLGLLAGGIVAGLLRSESLALLADIHLNWGLAGAVGLLLIGVAYQVVPLFQVTPEYPGWMRRILAPGLFSVLLIWTLSKVAVVFAGWPAELPEVLLALLLVGFCLFALVTLSLQLRRRRRIADVTLKFWRVGMVAIILCLLFWGIGWLYPEAAQSPRFALLFGVLLILGAAVALVNGMLYKIVAFLPWFHLQHRQIALMRFEVTVPHMRAFVPQAAADRQFFVWLLSLAAALSGVFWPQQMVRPAGLLFATSNLLLFYNLLSAVVLYRRTDRELRSKCADAPSDENGRPAGIDR